MFGWIITDLWKFKSFVFILKKRWVEIRREEVMWERLGVVESMEVDG